MQFGNADFWPKMDPIRPKITQNVPNSFPIYYFSLLYFIKALEAHWKAVVGTEPKKAKNDKFCNRILRPNLFNTVKYALNTIRRIIRIRRMTHSCFQQKNRRLISIKVLCLHYFLCLNSILCLFSILCLHSMCTQHGQQLQGQQHRGDHQQDQGSRLHSPLLHHWNIIDFGARADGLSI